MAAPVLATKFYIPPPPPIVVTRSRLLEKLNEGLLTGCAITLVSAPTGLGKTTLNCIEKAETEAIGTALAMGGYGALQAPEFDEHDTLADAPVEKAKDPNWVLRVVLKKLKATMKDLWRKQGEALFLLTRSSSVFRSIFTALFALQQEQEWLPFFQCDLGPFFQFIEQWTNSEISKSIQKWSMRLSSAAKSKRGLITTPCQRIPCILPQDESAK